MGLLEHRDLLAQARRCRAAGRRSVAWLRSGLACEGLRRRVGAFQLSIFRNRSRSGAKLRVQRQQRAAERAGVRADGAGQQRRAGDALPAVAVAAPRPVRASSARQQLAAERAVDDHALQVEQAGGAVDRQRDRRRGLAQPVQRGVRARAAAARASSAARRCPGRRLAVQLPPGSAARPRSAAAAAPSPAAPASAERHRADGAGIAVQAGAQVAVDAPARRR